MSRSATDYLRHILDESMYLSAHSRGLTYKMSRNMLVDHRRGRAVRQPPSNSPRRGEDSTPPPEGEAGWGQPAQPHALPFHPTGTRAPAPPPG